MLQLFFFYHCESKNIEILVRNLFVDVKFIRKSRIGFPFFLTKSFWLTDNAISKRFWSQLTSAGAIIVNDNNTRFNNNKQHLRKQEKRTHCPKSTYNHVVKITEVNQIIHEWFEYDTLQIVPRKIDNCERTEGKFDNML